MRTPQQFMQIVRETLDRGEICILYARSYIGPLVDPNKIWPEMSDPEWRRAVTVGTFSPPDDLDGWSYVAYPNRVAMSPRIVQTTFHGIKTAKALHKLMTGENIDDATAIELLQRDTPEDYD